MSEIKVDTVAEKTSANGVTIDGLNIKDSKLVTSNSIVEANITDGAISAAKLASGVGAGITEVDMWRLNTYYSGLQNPINANWERADTEGFSHKGTGLTQSSGVFSFPSTGFWYIDFNWSGVSQTDTRNIGAGISATEDNSSFTDLGYGSTFLQRTQSDSTIISMNINCVFKVDNITTHKIRFFGGAANINSAPDTNAQTVGFTCFRLTDI